MMEERARRFGVAEHLVGVVGLPEAAGNIGVIMVNTGMVYRVGPFRLHVELARRLNAEGYPTLRFDLSTLGDSGASGRPLSRIDQACADVAEAMDLLAREAGCSRFVLFGLCSGAAVAHQASRRLAPRVAGAVFIDGYTYRTLGFMLRYYVPLLLHIPRVLRSIARLGSRLRGAGDIEFVVAIPPRAEVRADYQRMLAEGMKLCFIYSGGIGYYFNHPRQFRESFGRRLASHRGVTLHQLPRTDHTYSLVGDRALLIDTIVAWLHANLPVDLSHEQAS